ncbi:hypothetical protein PENSPDRAFT_748278 [Peniophora sp. CONT]|nr:hypothetical protein PENSPDRAFT_748278 [Peniophora sp. CONT]
MNHKPPIFLLDLPPELLLPVLSEALIIHPNPAAVLSTCKHLRDLGEPLLYRHLTLRSSHALILCSKSSARRHRIRTVDVRLAGGEVGSGQIAELGALLFLHLNEIAPGGCTWNQHPVVKTRLQLDEMRLCMNSQSSPAKDDTELCVLGLIDPRSFTWIGPDPPHQFSTAIVPDACVRVFTHAAQWSSLRTIFLSNVAFPSSRSPNMTPSSSPPTSIFTSPAPPTQESFTFPIMPTLERMVLRNATCFPAKALATLVCSDAMESLSHIGLEDCYVESIWGERVRRSHVEQATLELDNDIKGPERIDRVRAIVVCSAMYERIEGGDRVTLRNDGQGVSLLE